MARDLYDGYTIRDLQDIRAVVTGLTWANSANRSFRESGGSMMSSVVDTVRHHTKMLDDRRRADALAAVAYILARGDDQEISRMAAGAADRIVNQLADAGQLPDEVDAS